VHKIIKRIKHFILLAVLNLFQTLHIYKLFGKDPRIIRIYTSRLVTQFDSVCIFASFSRTDEIPEYVLHYLEKIKAEGFDIVFVTTAAGISSTSLSKLLSLCLKIIHRKNTGLDFGSWKAGILHAEIDLKKYHRLLLTNDSCYAPLFPLTELLGKAEGDLYGITDSYEVKYHIMSYFVLYDAKIFHSDMFRKVWKDVRMIPTRFKGLIVRLYEVGMSQYYLSKKSQLNVYCPVNDLIKKTGAEISDLNRLNSVHKLWKGLIEEMRCPVLKIDLFWRYFEPHGDRTWETVLAQTDYNPDLIHKHRKSI
jgi:lipopolysaccharide biosynthesis protein